MTKRVDPERRRIVAGGNDAWAVAALLAAEDVLYRRLGVPEPETEELNPQQEKIADKAYSVAWNAVHTVLAEALEQGRTTADLVVPALPDESVSVDQAMADLAVRALVERMNELDLSVVDMLTYLQDVKPVK